MGGLQGKGQEGQPHDGCGAGGCPALALAPLDHCLSVCGRPEVVELSMFLKGRGG